MPHVQANGVDLFYDLTGPADAPAVVFSNCLGTTLETWDYVLPALAGRYRCVRYDKRGHGRSQIVDAPLTIEVLADDLAGLLRALGIDAAQVVGLSIGAMIGLAVAVRHPGMVRSLSLLATTAHMPPPEAIQERARLVRARGTEVIAEALMGRWFTPLFISQEPHKVGMIRDRFVTIDTVGYARCCEAIAAMDLRSSIGAIAVPTLIISGAQDPATPPAVGEDIRSRIADSELVVITRAAHLMVVEQPAASAAHLLGFLDRHPGGAAPPDRPDRFSAGLANRKAALGVEHVERSLERAGPFGLPWQEFITKVAWNDVWGDPALPWKTRSMLTVGLMIALRREDEFKLHVRAARRNGVTPEELRALLMHVAVYAGVPATNAAFRWVREALG